MRLQIVSPLYRLLKATQFWKENYLILRGLKYSRSVIAFAVLFSILAALFSALSVGCIASFLQGLTNPNEPPIQTGIQWIDVWFLGTQAEPSNRIYRIAGLLLATIWLQFTCMYLGQVNIKTAILSLTNHLRKELFEQLQGVSLKFYAKTRTGALMNTVRGEVNQVSKALEIISNAFTQCLMLIAYIYSMFWISWQLSAIALMIFSLLSVGISNIAAKIREYSFDVTRANKQFTSTALEFINGIRTVHAAGTQEFERRRFYRMADLVNEMSERSLTLAAMVNPLVQGFSSTMVILMVAVAFNIFVSNGELKAASLIAFLFALNRTGPLVSQLNAAWTQFNSMQGSLESVTALLQRHNKPYLVDGQVEFMGLKHSIDLIAVDFGYTPEAKVLQDITLSICQGETTALVGGSGAGKSTLADLIARFYDPTQGQILVDGVDLREFRINSLRQRMAIVSQDTFIFHTSARENIAYGLEEVDDTAVIEAARQANALEFIQALPQGFETQLGDRGVRLSGGQRQRIAIARALLRDPEILILDEATSALDSVTERLIQESLERLAQGRTVIAIAHRLSTIVRADKVVVLEKGRVVEQGKYQELLERRGKLWRYHQMQNQAGQLV